MDLVRTRPHVSPSQGNPAYNKLLTCISYTQITNLVTQLNSDVVLSQLNEDLVERLLYIACDRPFDVDHFNRILSTKSYRVEVLGKIVVNALVNDKLEFLNYLLGACEFNYEHREVNLTEVNPTLLQPVLSGAKVYARKFYPLCFADLLMDKLFSLPAVKNRPAIPAPEAPEAPEEQMQLTTEEYENEFQYALAMYKIVEQCLMYDSIDGLSCELTIKNELNSTKEYPQIALYWLLCDAFGLKDTPLPASFQATNLMQLLLSTAKYKNTDILAFCIVKGLEDKKSGFVNHLINLFADEFTDNLESSRVLTESLMKAYSLAQDPAIALTRRRYILHYIRAMCEPLNLTLNPPSRF